MCCARSAHVGALVIRHLAFGARDAGAVGGRVLSSRYQNGGSCLIQQRGCASAGGLGIGRSVDIAVSLSKGMTVFAVCFSLVYLSFGTATSSLRLRKVRMWYAWDEDKVATLCVVEKVLGLR